MNKPEFIIIHHSKTYDSQTATWPVVRRIHIHDNGWDDIGYHYGIEDVRGTVEIIKGRFDDQSGAHCPGYNSKSLGVCVIGNHDDGWPGRDHWDKALKLCRELMRVYNIPRENVLGHREAMRDGRTCPGRNWHMDAFRELL